MKNLTIIVAVAISSMVVAQPGKGQGNGGQTEKSNKKESSGNHSNQKGNQGGSERNGHNDQKNVFVSEQGKKDQGKNDNRGGSGKQGNNDSYKGGNDRNGHSQPNKGNNKPVFHQDKGHGNNGGKSHRVGNPGNGNNGKHFKGNGRNDKNFKGNNGNGHKGNGHYYKGKPGKIHYAKGHPNFGYVYVNQPVYYTGSNYGQWRAAEARKKHRHDHPVYEYQAVEGYNLIVFRNRYLYTETDNKINLLRIRLADRRKAGLITVVEYDNNIRQIEVIERRRAAIEVNVVI